MLSTIATVLIILWLLGFLGFHILGGFIHILLILALVTFLLKIILGKK